MSFRPGQPSRGLDLDVPLGDAAAADLMWVPFFVKEPGQTGGAVSDRPTSTLDVLPTIADVPPRGGYAPSEWRRSIGKDRRPASGALR